MAQLLGQVQPGTTLYVKNSGGTKLPFYVGVHNYQSVINGLGRTLLVSQNAAGTMPWNSAGQNTYATCTIDNWLNTTYLGFFDETTQGKIGTTQFYYTVGGGSENVNSLARAIFLLSVKELGVSYQYANSEGTSLPIATTINVQSQWTRSSTLTTDIQSCKVQNRSASGVICTQSENIYPAFTLPESLYVLDDGTISMYPIPPVLTVPSQAMQGQSIPINWTASANADSYQLQRKADSGEWETIYTGSDLTFTDTAGSWSTVQYQVAAGLGGEYGEYATSAVIPVVSASALVISGANEDLGTITADISYTVSSDTGNQITLSRTVNGVQYASATVSSGFAYNIPVMELPTGAGTIVITASVQATSGPVTATRTWTYTKTAQTFPASAGVGSLAQNGASFLPQTLAECVRTNPFWGGSLSTALEMLTSVALNGAQIEVGSYVGTGTSGSSNPNSLTFGFAPKVLIVTGDWGSGSDYRNPYFSAILNVQSGAYQFSTTQYNEAPCSGTISLSGITVSWSSTGNSGQQGNVSGKTYNYVAIG